MTERNPHPDPLPQAGEGARGRAALRRNVGFARRLRRDSTDVEKRLWQALRAGQFGVRFRRQHPIDPYVVDFVCLERRLIIELDGGQHGPEVDRKRSRCLEEAGFHVLRFWNTDLTGNFPAVLETITNALSRLREREGPDAERREGEGCASASMLARGEGDEGKE